MGYLRTLFALAVLLGHAGLTETYQPMIGATAVQAFYIVSGFYMALVYNEIYAPRYAAPKRVFWMSRFLRLAPLYIVVAALAYLATNGAAFQGLDLGTSLILALSHVLLIGQDVWLFLTYHPADGLDFTLSSMKEGLATLPAGSRHGTTMLLIPQGWSIGIEMWFYLFAPFLMLRSPRAIGLICLGLFVLRIGAYYWTGLNIDPWTYRFFPFELAVFLLGVLSYHGYKIVRDDVRLLSYGLPVLAVLLVLALAYAYLPGGQQEKRYIFLALLTMGVPFVFSLTKDWRSDRMIGDLSYPIYILHLLVFQFISGAPGALLAIGAAVVATVILERPFERLRRRLLAGAPRSAPIPARIMS